METIKLSVRLMLAIVAGAVTFLATMYSTCDDVGGALAWERCTTFLGTPAPFELRFPLDLVAPIALALAVGVGVWWLLGRTPLKPR